MGPTFAKVGQLLSLRPDLVGTEAAASLARLRERSRVVSLAQIRRQVEDQLGGPLESFFVAFDPEPLGCGSLAQVHRAERPGGLQVAVKVIKPGVGARVVRETGLLRLLTRVIDRVGISGSLPVGVLGDQIATVIERQLDLRREARCQMRVAENFRDSPEVRVPRVIEELSTQGVLVTELVRRTTAWSEAALSPLQWKVVCTSGLRALYKMIFSDGLVHVDLHPGNLILIEGGCLALIDFGLAVELEDQARRDFRRFFLGMAINDGVQCADLLLSTAQHIPDNLDRLGFTLNIQRHVASFAGLKVREFEVGLFAAGLFENQRHFGICGSTDFTLIIMSLLFFEGVIKRFAPDLDFQAESLPFLLSTFESSAPPLDATRSAVEELARQMGSRLDAPAGSHGPAGPLRSQGVD